MDTLLAIASRRDERRTLPEPLPPELVAPAARRRAAFRLVPQRAALDVRRPDGTGRGSRSSRPQSSSPRTCSTAGLVVAILVHGKGPVLFDAGRAAQSMLLAAWAEGIASCPNGIADADRARRALDATDDETPVIVLSFGLPERAARPERHTAAEWSARANRKPLDEVVRWLP